MKKILSLILLCVCTALFAACGNAASSQTSQQPAVTQPETTTAAETTVLTEDKTVPADKNTTAETVGTPDSSENKTLVIYFSRTGNTEKIAKYLIELTGADSYVIKAAVPYSDADIEYSNDSCRANKEQNDKSVRPEIANPISSIDSYDTIFLGYPIW